MELSFFNSDKVNAKTEDTAFERMKPCFSYVGGRSALLKPIFAMLLSKSSACSFATLPKQQLRFRACF